MSSYKNSKGNIFGFARFRNVKDSLRVKKALNDVCFLEWQLFASEERYDHFCGVHGKVEVEVDVRKIERLLVKIER